MAKLDQTFSEVKSHYDDGFNETDSRRIGRGRVGSISFDEADELFRSWIDEKKWPYSALLFDPRTFTFIFEKTARLLSNQLQGHLIPREGSDALGAHVNNELLKFQWDQATHDGSMLSKWAQMDINTRKYGASFALCRWRYEENRKGDVVFDGPEMKVLNNRDCSFDASATSIETCNWFQYREYVTFEELKRVNDASRGKPVYKNLELLAQKMAGEKSNGPSDSRDTNWISRNRTISGLQQTPIGNDRAFPQLELCHEFRKDKWISFAPRHGVVVREIEDPYGIYQIPVTMLRYYPIDDDLYGLSEIEPIKSLQKAINALLCQYVDEINQKLYTPVAIGPGVRQHTLEWGKSAKWQMNNPMTDFRIVETNSNAAAYFNNTYSALVAAMMNALGESSLGVSNIDRYQSEKTATEIKQLTQQRNARDNFNQIFLGEAIERQMKLWHAMNQSMIFSDPKKKISTIRIVGKDALRYFQDIGLDGYGLTEEAKEKMEAKILELIQQNPSIEEKELRKQMEKYFQTPIYPIEIKEGEETVVKPRLSVSPNGVGQLYIQPSDLMGTYDFIADVRSMALNAGEDEKVARNKAITSLLSNPNVIALLGQEGVRPKFKQLFVSWLEDSGFKDADRFFERIPQEEMQAMMQQAQQAQGQEGTASGVPGFDGRFKPNMSQGTPISQGGAMMGGAANGQAAPAA